MAPVPKPKKRGKARLAELAINDGGEKRSVLEGRLAQFGISLKSETREDGTKDMAAARRNECALKAMDSQAMGYPAGRAIYLATGGREAQELWEVYSGLVSAEERYARLVLGVSLSAKVAKVEYLPDRLATSADDVGPDLRDEDQRYQDAVNGWMRWRGLVGRLLSDQQVSIFDVVRDRVKPHDAGNITAAGRRFISALRALRVEVDKRG